MLTHHALWLKHRIWLINVQYCIGMCTRIVCAYHSAVGEKCSLALGSLSKLVSYCLQEFFGTSKAFGFTKKNELFVGRTAMLVSSDMLHAECLPSLCDIVHV